LRLLLDTHALIWWFAGKSELSTAARAAVADSDNEVYVSAVSAWEISTKFRIGKLPKAAALANDIASAIAGQAFSELTITVPHAQHAGALPGPLRDPFDRMLIAQSVLDSIPLVSNEEIFDRYGVKRIW
jgi:PIN domain nuclease of toxin-antitoxin system